ncbi:PREDICTED: uncharacterized protein LOC106813804 [Priapulus caudatus]|uniref:Uncharacterized protein LOC106813804 n=1 Tax=Priapulus caudatus TaxID=37621 RepID=A0ABM1EMU3_PRICU|nr:PREDICTED: uncharacterized protein LOC106813804 [Priapulus caudatus]
MSWHFLFLACDVIEYLGPVTSTLPRATSTPAPSTETRSGATSAFISKDGATTTSVGTTTTAVEQNGISKLVPALASAAAAALLMVIVIVVIIVVIRRRKRPDTAPLSTPSSDDPGGAVSTNAPANQQESIIYNEIYDSSTPQQTKLRDDVGGATSQPGGMTYNDMYESADGAAGNNGAANDGDAIYNDIYEGGCGASMQVNDIYEAGASADEYDYTYAPVGGATGQDVGADGVYATIQ